jgi:hypothetical protein
MPASGCSPASRPYRFVTSISGNPDNVGFTKADDLTMTGLAYRAEFKGGMCGLKVLKEAAFALKRFVFTAPGSYRLEEGDIARLQPAPGSCKGAPLDRYVEISPAVSDKIRDGEIEHCNDFQLAFDRTYGVYNTAARDLEKAGPFPTTDEAACQSAVELDLSARAGVDVGRWKKTYICLIDGSGETRDKINKWHTMYWNLGTQTVDCSTSRYTITPDLTTTKPGYAPNFSEVGKHPSTAVVPDPLLCGLGIP